MSKMEHTTCPICGGGLVDFGSGIKCEANNKDGSGCSFIMWKNAWGHPFTSEEFDKLLSRERIIIDCKNKEKKPYKKEIYMNDDWEITFDEPFVKEDKSKNNYV